MHLVVHFPRTGCLTVCLVAIQESLGPFKSILLSKASELHPAGISPSNQGSFRSSKDRLGLIISWQVDGLYFWFRFDTELGGHRWASPEEN